MDYLLFSRSVYNLYIDITGFQHIPDSLKPDNLLRLSNLTQERNNKFKAFDEYIKKQIKEIGKQIEDLK
ncbi:hypothetical protein [Lysinibacillus sp. RC79]|uniref:hypothetical protein n=1 Tax=Lysinibacillus sp. RC79 TaxID=3156296 RepID=UPI003514EDD0